MVEYLGVVIEVKENKAFVMTDSCEVVCIRKQPGMYEGLEIIFEPSEIVNKTKTAAKYSAIIGSVAAVFIAVLFYINIFYTNQIYAYVDIDINTSWELVVDKENRVIDIKSHDKNSETIFDDLDIKKKPLEVALVDMVQKLDEKGIIDLDSDNKVLITACLDDKDGGSIDEKGLKNLHISYNKIKDELSSRNIEPYFMEIKSDDRKLAADNNLSMGRYSVFKIGKEKGLDLDIEKLKQSQIGEIVEKIDIKEEFEDINKDTDNILNNNENASNQKADGDKVDQENKNENSSNIVDDGGKNLSIDGISDIDNIEAIESANKETQKVIERIQQQINSDVVFETEKANKEISQIKINSSLSYEEKLKE